MMDEIGNDYDNKSEKNIIPKLKPQNKNKNKKKVKREADSQGYHSNNSDIRMGGNVKREKYKTIC